MNSEDNKPFLYPCSNLHRDTLKEVLTSNGKHINLVCELLCQQRQVFGDIYGSCLGQKASNALF